MNLNHKVAIVTGGGRGIGKAIALALAAEGADVVVASRTLSEIEETALEIKSLGRKALAIKADVSSQQDVERMVNLTLKELGRMDILVNNAGALGPIGSVVENDAEDWVKALRANLIGTFLSSKAVLPIMIKQRRGKIINLSGGGAAYGRPFFSAYASSKAAVVRFTECLAEEVKEYNIQVNAIAPGAVNTQMQDEVLAAGHKAGEEALVQAMRIKKEGGVPPQDAAALVVFWASADSNGLTGRLISAVWDNWRNINKQRAEEIMSKELYTLRRIDRVFFCSKEQRETE